jgi:hypothetical protein
MACAIHAHQAGGHGFQQGALGARAGPVDFISQQHLAKQGSGVKAELTFSLLIHRYATEIGGEQVVGEVHPVEGQPEAAGQGFGQGGFAHTGQVFNQQVAAGEQAGHGEAHLLRLAQHHRIDLGEHLIQARLQRCAHTDSFARARA